MPDVIRIATRQSPLALWQANDVRARLLQNDPALQVELLPLTTKGDRWLGTSLAKLGGKGLFIKELELALLDGRADLAVHSMKDVTASLPDGLGISTVLAREDPYDALVSARYSRLEELPGNAVIGTCSPRRLSQLLNYNPDFVIHDLRGNVNTRLAKLDAGEFDAIILACAGLRRLGFVERIQQTLSVELCLPAVGQGIIGIETRNSDGQLRKRLAPLHDADTASRLAAERALSAELNGGCSAPIAGYTELAGQTLTLTGRVISMDGKTLLACTSSANVNKARHLGIEVANRLRDQGAQAILDAAAASHEA